MAYYADLDSNNIVLGVQIVNDVNVQGTDAQNEQWCDSNLAHETNGVSWKRTYKDGSQNGRYAGVGHKFYTSDIPGHPGTANKFLEIIPSEHSNQYSLDSDNLWIPLIAEPTLDDQGRDLPYDALNIPEDCLFWGYNPENDRWEGGRLIDGSGVYKYYDLNTSTWITWNG